MQNENFDIVLYSRSKADFSQDDYYCSFYLPAVQGVEKWVNTGSKNEEAGRYDVHERDDGRQADHVFFWNDEIVDHRNCY